MARKNSGKKFNNFVLLIGAFALGIFTITAFAKAWGFLMTNANMVLLITGGIMGVLILIGVLSPKRVRKSLMRSVRRFMA